MKHNTEAQKAVDTLNPLFQDALAKAQEKFDGAEQRLAAIKPDLVATILAGESKDDPATINTFLSSVQGYTNGQPNGVLSLFLDKFQKTLITGEPARILARAILHHLKNPTAGLLVFTDAWHETLGLGQLQQLASLVNPEGLERLQQDRQTACLDLASAQHEINRVKAMLEALQTLQRPMFKAAPVFRITNNSGANTGFKGIRFPESEPVSIERQQLADLMQNQSFASLVKAGKMAIA